MTPHATTGVSPVELLLHFTISHVQGSTSFSPRLQIVLRINSLSRSLMIVLHRDTVYARNFREGEGWLPGHIVEVAGPVSYNIQLDDGLHWKRHQDHIRSCLVVPDDSPDIPSSDTTLSGTPSESKYFLNLLLWTQHLA